MLGTLRTFDAKTKDENVAEKRAEIDKKVDEKIATDRRKIIEEKKDLMKKRHEKEKLLGLLQTKQDMAENVSPILKTSIILLLGQNLERKLEKTCPIYSNKGQASNFMGTKDMDRDYRRNASTKCKTRKR